MGREDALSLGELQELDHDDGGGGGRGGGRQGLHGGPGHRPLGLRKVSGEVVGGERCVPRKRKKGECFARSV